MPTTLEAPASSQAAPWSSDLVLPTAPLPLSAPQPKGWRKLVGYLRVLTLGSAHRAQPVQFSRRDVQSGMSAFDHVARDFPDLIILFISS